MEETVLSAETELKLTEDNLEITVKTENSWLMLRSQVIPYYNVLIIYIEFIFQ